MSVHVCVCVVFVSFINLLCKVTRMSGTSFSHIRFKLHSFGMRVHVCEYANDVGRTHTHSGRDDAPNEMSVRTHRRVDKGVAVVGGSILVKLVASALVHHFRDHQFATTTPSTMALL